MKRLLFLLLLLAVPAFVVADMGIYFQEPNLSVRGYTDADSTRDIKKYFAINNFSSGLRGMVQPSSFVAKIYVFDGDEMAGNEDSARVYLYRKFGGVTTLFDSTKVTNLPCSLYVAKPCVDADGGSLGDTLWRGEIGFYVNIDSDTTDDTAFYSNYPITIEATLK